MRMRNPGSGAKKKILCVFGTRPEAIKMAPVVLGLKARKGFVARVAVTAQHREMLDQVMAFFGIRSDHDLNLMRDGQSLTEVSSLGLTRLQPVLARERPDLVLVHGDTTTTIIAALASYYQKIPVGHVEAGLRSFDPHNPFPEEINRRLTDAVSVLHFAPTQTAKKNLLREGVSPKGIFITGNTGIDALHLGLGKLKRNRPPAIGHREFILVTAHRRENFGKPLDNICRAIRRVARARPGLRFVYPVHPNPNVGGTVRALLGSVPNVSLLPPLDYAEFLPLLRDCRFVLTDSGGLQEEAPSLGKPVLVLRKVTERPEAVRAGTVRIIGTDERAVRRWMERLLDDNGLYRRMANAVNPYGDGRAAARTVEAIAGFFHLGPKRFKDFRPAGFRRR